ncbi:hypothetical protein PHYC_01134 [Phycisphaerales bacterium]|nr:hypothetical protein PHYC_01134 [Phycisphaerales bacterium]
MPESRAEGAKGVRTPRSGQPVPRPASTAKPSPAPQSTALPRARPAPIATVREATPLPHTHIKYGIAGAAALLVLVALLLGTLPIKIGVALLGLCVLQGLWRGASELAGLVVGSVLAIPLAPPIARGLESPIGAMLGTSGLANRFLCITIVALIVVIAAGAAVSIAARKFMKARTHWRTYDQYAGAGLGLIEGCLILMLVLWVPLALEPVAASQIPPPRPEWLKGEPEKPGVLAQGVLDMARKVKESSLGGLAQATNPVDGSRLMGLAADFAAITRDPAAMEFLLESQVMKDIQALPSMQSSMERLKGDPEINDAVFGPNGVTPDFLRTIIASQTILDIFDTTTIVDDVTPFAERLEQAIMEAKMLIGTHPDGG